MGLDYIDTSVYLGMVFEEDDKYWDFLRIIGYKSRNRGLISELVLGEILNHVISDINDEDYRLELSDKKYAMELLDGAIGEKEKEGKLFVLPLSSRIDLDILNELEDVDRQLSYDDALHLAMAVSSKCKRFVTDDKYLVESFRLKDFLKEKFNLKIIEVPAQS